MAVLHSSHTLFSRNKVFLSDLPYSYQHLVRTAYSFLPYGQIHHLALREGDLILHHPLELMREYKNTRQAGPQAPPPLTPQSEIGGLWRKFFCEVAEYRSGHVCNLKFRAGDPVSYQILQLSYLDELARTEHWPPYDVAKDVDPKSETQNLIH